MSIKQKKIAAVEQMPNIPSPFHVRDWQEVAHKYDAFVFNFDAKGDFLPLIWWDKTHRNFDRDTFGLYTYIGSVKEGEGDAHEGINCIGAVLGATLAGIDKSRQDGHNWVLMCENYFNRANGENLFLNRTDERTGGSFWYEIFPSILIYALLHYYPGTGNMEEEMQIAAERWYEAAYHMGGSSGVPDFDHTAFRFADLTPVDNGRWKEPDAAAGIAWLEYMAYVRFGDEKYLTAADWGMRFLQDRDANPFYEILMPYGAYVAARMNAELGRSYDVGKFLDWCFDGDSICRPGWGVITERWGDIDCHGLVGSKTDGGGYAFAMNTFETAAALVPLVRYDTSYARAIGKWMLNLANNARLFYPNFHPRTHQSCSFWQGDPEHVIPYEGLRKEWDGKSPYATGDPIRFAWGSIDIGLYGGSHVGVLGGIVRRTNDRRILQLDCLRTDYYRDEAYPTHLYYNPYPEARAVEIEVGSDPKDLYDAVRKSFIREGVAGTVRFTVPADNASVIVVAPAGRKRQRSGSRLLVDGVVVDYNFPGNGDC